MIQHHGYPPESHGYYYYQPYNYSRVAIKQAFVEQWGGDPRNPYSFELFARLKEELEESGARGEELNQDEFGNATDSAAQDAAGESQWESLPPAPSVPRRELPQSFPPGG